MIFVYILIGLIMQLMFWFIPDVVANAIVVSLLGFIIGPFFPAGVSVITKLLPKDLHIASIGKLTCARKTPPTSQTFRSFRGLTLSIQALAPASGKLAVLRFHFSQERLPPRLALWSYNP